MTTPSPPLFGVLPTGHIPITTPSASPTPTSFLYALPPRSYSHIAVFLLPGTVLPPDTAAAVYLLLPSSPGEAAPRFLGAIGTGKESAVFKVGGVGDGREMTIGISIEGTGAVAALIQAQAESQSQSQSQIQSQSEGLSSSSASASELGHEAKVALAQKIIRNAFHFLASYSGNLQNGVEVVPLKAFEEWWRRFEGRVRNDRGFLEREESGEGG